MQYNTKNKYFFKYLHLYMNKTRQKEFRYLLQNTRLKTDMNSFEY